MSKDAVVKPKLQWRLKGGGDAKNTEYGTRTWKAKAAQDKRP
jgi:hypothetical protein